MAQGSLVKLISHPRLAIATAPYSPADLYIRFVLSVEFTFMERLP